MTSNFKSERVRRPVVLALVCLLTMTALWVGGRSWNTERLSAFEIVSMETVDDGLAPHVTGTDHPRIAGITPILFEGQGGDGRQHPLRVMVVDPEGAPVANVLVTVAAEPRALLRWTSLAGPGDCLTMPPKEVIATQVSNAQGIVTLPFGVHSALRLRGEQGKLAGELLVTESDRVDEPASGSTDEPAPRVLSLAPRRTLRVRVVDGSDRGIADAIAVIVDPEAEFVAPEFFVGSFHMSHFRSSRTDGTGLARFDLLDHGRRAPFHARKLWIFVLRFGGTHFAAERMWSDESEFTVHVPDLIALTLQPVDAAGQALATPVVASFAHGSPPSDYGSSFEVGTLVLSPEDLATTYLSAWRLILPPGGARVAAFHRGGAVGYSLSAEGRADASAVLDGAAPGLLVAKLAVGPELAKVTFRLRDSTGRPAPLDAYQIERFSEPAGTYGDLPTECDRVYVATVPPHVSGGLLLLDRNRSRSDGGANAVLATVRWPSLAPGVDHDLGTLAVPDIERLVSGKLVDATGSLLPRTGFTVVEFPAGSPTGDWIHGVTDDSGHFEVFRPALVNATYSVAVALTSTTMSSDEVRFVPGASDVTVTAYRNGGLSGRLLASPDVADSLVVELRGVGVPVQRTVTLRSSLHFDEVGLRPGVYELVARLGREEVRRVPGIEILAGELAKPLSLQSLAVAENYAGASVTVLDAEGIPVRWALISVGYDGEFQGVGRFAQTDGRGEAHLVLRQGPRKTLRVNLSLTRHRDRFANDPPLEIDDPVFPLTVRLPK